MRDAARSKEPAAGVGLTPTTAGVLPVTVTNTGSQTWPADSAYQLGSHLVAPAIFEFSRANLTAPVPPGGSTILNLPIPALAPGTYTVNLDMVRNPLYWFASTGGQATGSPAQSIVFTVLPGLGASTISPSNNGTNFSTPSESATVSLPVNPLCQGDVRPLVLL